MCFANETVGLFPVTISDVSLLLVILMVLQVIGGVSEERVACLSILRDVSWSFCVTVPQILEIDVS